LPKNAVERAIGNQLVRRRTLVAANYRSACRERSKADFISKLGMVVEEADGSDFWLELLIDGKIIKREWVEPLLKKQENLPLFSLVR
tara:strand:- start:363 stop:623 length:261 start_codon:yes stop_codon:yes gene_type:complete